MAERIKLLPEIVANQIAAGEVVKHPSSVVKEMMENSIDAGAHMVKVNFRDGGRDLIQIVDDGCGMSPLDARLAFDRHATSKISSIDDIYTLTTFGFRGEALASIAAVAEVELRSRQEGDEIGMTTQVNGGEFISQTPVMCPVGAQFFVRNLFYNVPARRRFLDKSAKASSQIKSEFQRVALCYPQVAFELYANDAPLYSLPVNSLAGRIVDVVGRHIKPNLLEVQADTTIAKVEGYIGRPSSAKRRNSEQFLFVNGRYFKSAYITSAILKAYDKLIPESATPSYFIYLKIDPQRIDVNVHPQKLEVKFADEEAVWQIVNASVRETLAKTGAVPMMDFDNDENVEIPVMDKDAVYGEPRAMSNDAYNPFVEEFVDLGMQGANLDFAAEDIPSVEFSREPSPLSELPERPVRQRGAAGGRRHEEDNFIPVAAREFGLGETVSDSFRDFISGEVENGEEEYAEIESGAELPRQDEEESSLEFIPSAGDAQEQVMFDVESQAEFSEVMPLRNGYVAALLSGHFVVVDVKRAKERILYEDYLRMLKNGSSVSQQLLFPERLLLSLDEYALLEENAVEFAGLGFDIDFEGDGAIEVKGAPAELASESVDRLIYELLQAFATPQSLEELRKEKIALAMARAASKSGVMALSREEAEALLRQLSESGNISFSPSGKSVMAEFSVEDIRAKLGR